MNTLNHLSALITRPDPEGGALCGLIINEGGRAVHFPTIEFSPADENYFHQEMASLKEHDCLIFNSPQSVYHSLTILKNVYPHWAKEIKIAAIGQGTAKVLQDNGFHVDLVPTEWSSEGLLNLPFFNAIQHKKIAIIKGEGGRLLLEQTLKTRGASVLTVMAYRRRAPDVSSSHVLYLLNHHRINLMVCASFEAVNNLKMLAQNGWSLLKDIPLIVVSERIKKLADDLGYKTIWIARNASNNAILERIKICLSTIKMKNNHQ